MKIVSVLVLLILAGAGTAFFLAQKDYRQKETIKISVVDQYSNKKKVSFTVEIADDAAKRAKGLMFLDQLAKNEGMIFVFPKQKEHAFWMKDTKLSLDMIFIDQDGKIAGLVERAKPETLDPLGKGIESVYVLEINAGLAKEYKIKKGDIVKGLDELVAK